MFSPIECIIYVLLGGLYIKYTVEHCISAYRDRHPIIIHTSFPDIQEQVVQKIDIEKVAPLIDPGNCDHSCPICFDDLKDVKYVRKTLCGHSFCSECLREWFHKKPVCPLCQLDLLQTDSIAMNIV